MFAWVVYTNDIAIGVYYTMECQAAFDQLKSLFAGEPVPQHPNPEEQFNIQADASNVVEGKVLLSKNSKRDL